MQRRPAALQAVARRREPLSIELVIVDKDKPQAEAVTN
jgi:hypothetical protein